MAQGVTAFIALPRIPVSRHELDFVPWQSHEPSSADYPAQSTRLHVALHPLPNIIHLLPVSAPGLQRDDVVGQDLRDLFTTTVSANQQPSTGVPPPLGASEHVPQAGIGAGTLVSTAPPGAPLVCAPSGKGSAAMTATAATGPTALSDSHVPIPWEQHQSAVAAQEDIVLHNVVLPAGGAAAGGPLATLHFRFVPARGTWHVMWHPACDTWHLATTTPCLVAACSTGVVLCCTSTPAT